MNEDLIKSICGIGVIQKVSRGRTLRLLLQAVSPMASDLAIAPIKDSFIVLLAVGFWVEQNDGRSL
jgi:hypothetical protein